MCNTIICDAFLYESLYLYYSVLNTMQLYFIILDRYLLIYKYSIFLNYIIILFLIYKNVRDKCKRFIIQNNLLTFNSLPKTVELKFN